MTIRKRTIIITWLIVLVLLNLGFGKLTTNDFLASTNITLLVTSISAPLLAMMTYEDAQNNKVSGRTAFNNIRWYLMLVITIWLVEILYSLVIYNHSASNSTWWINGLRFLELLLAYPIYYILNGKKGRKFIDTCLTLVIINLVIREISWFLYNYRQMLIFERLLFENNWWSRNGLQRCPATSITILFFVYTCVQYCDKKKIGYLINTLFILQYTFVVVNSRWAFIAEACVMLYIIMAQKNIRRSFTFKIITIVAFIILFFAYEPIRNLLPSIVELDIATNIYASSSIARLQSLINSIEIFFRHPLFGAGLYPSRITQQYSNLYFSDAGAIGTIANTGVLGIISIVGYMWMAIKGYKRDYHMKEHIFCGGILLSLVLVDLIVDASFTYQKIFSVPFVIAILAHIENVNIRRKGGEDIESSIS